jgi:hypothetical protein
MTLKHADLVVTYTYEYRQLPTFTTRPTPFGGAQTAQDGYSLESISVLDGQHPERVLYAKHYRDADAYMVVRSGGDQVLTELQSRLLKEQAKRAEKTSKNQ